MSIDYGSEEACCIKSAEAKGVTDGAVKEFNRLLTVFLSVFPGW
jgi:hypothetical protein